MPDTENARHRNDPIWYDLDPDEYLVLIRRRDLNRNFEWTPENTQKIISAIQGIDKKLNLMYDAVLRTKEFLESSAVPPGVRKHFTIHATMDYEPSEPLPGIDEEMMERLDDATNWLALPDIYFASGREMYSREQLLYGGLNWNINLFDRPELEHIKIPYYVHVLFVDEFSYSLSDMMNMKAEDFKIEIEVNFDGEAIV